MPKYRWFVYNEQVTDRIDRTDGDTFSTSGETAQLEVATALGVPFSHVTCCTGDECPTPQTTIAPTPSPEQPIDIPTAVQVGALLAPATGPLAVAKAILAKADADITAAEVKTVTLFMARYFLKKWLAGWR